MTTHQVIKVCGHNSEQRSRLFWRLNSSGIWCHAVSYIHLHNTTQETWIFFYTSVSSSNPSNVLFSIAWGQSGLPANGHNPVREDERSLHLVPRVGMKDYTSIPLTFSWHSACWHKKLLYLNHNSISGSTPITEKWWWVTLLHTHKFRICIQATTFIHP